jgi:pimeloyl-ACP methyl ester carboxylesterase
VFSHGLAGSIEHVRQLVNGLPARMILYDNRGHGRTRASLDPSTLSFSRMADDIALLLDHLGIKQAFVGGVSMGAGIALAFGLRWPTRALGLIVSRPAWLDRPQPQNLEFAGILAELIERYGVDQAWQAFERTSCYRDLYRVHPASASSLLTTIKSADPDLLKAMYRAMPASTPVRSIAEVHGMRLPTLLIGTLNDPIHPIEIAECWSAAIPRVRFEMIPAKLDDEEGHICEFQKHVKKFLADHGQPVSKEP